MSSDSESDSFKKFYDAVRNDESMIVEDLVRSKTVDVNYKFPSHDFKTAAHIAASKRDLKMLKTLVELNADLNASDKFNQVPIENAAGHYNYAAINYLLSINPEHASKVKNHINDTPEIDEFFEAVNKDNVAKAKQMLTDGIVNVNTPNKCDYNNSALHTACDNSYIEMVKMLVDDFQAELDVENVSEEIPIHCSHSEEVRDFLMSRGSDGID